MLGSKKECSKWYCAVGMSSANGMNAPSADVFLSGPFNSLEEAKKKHSLSWDAYGEQKVIYFKGSVEEESY